MSISLIYFSSFTFYNMHSVTSGAVANTFGNYKYTFPLKTYHYITNGTNWTVYMWMGNGYRDIFNMYPDIPGKTKKLRFLIQAFTATNNVITVGAKRNGDADYTILFTAVVWGGTNPDGFASVFVIDIDPSFLNPYTGISMHSSDGQNVAIGFVFAQVYYE